MEQPLVSVIMSVYNAEPWLKETIESVMQQTYANWEFVIIDDASTDGSKAILNAYKTDSRFNITYLEKNKGYVKNLNTCIALAKGKYVARLDADDVCMPNRFEEQVAFLEASTAKTFLVASFIDFIDENGNNIGLWPEDRKANTAARIRQSLPFGNCIAHPSIMAKASLIKQHYYNELQTNSEDWDLWLRVNLLGYSIEKINKALLKYRRLPQSVTSTSLTKSAFVKNNLNYKDFFKSLSADNKKNSYYILIYFAYIVNKCKMVLSKIYRSAKH
jgi:glycosyltransferase involved in cell wall biosynthesis